jgi:hypothetical protein
MQGILANRLACADAFTYYLEINLIDSQAIVTGKYILTGAGLPNRTGWFTTIWVRTPAGWRMVHDHSS